MPSKIQPTPNKVAVHTGARGKVNVFNTTTQRLGQAFYVDDPNSSKLPDRYASLIPKVRVVYFDPGNNEIDADDWEAAKKETSVQTWVSPIDRLDARGNFAKGLSLIEGKVDNRFTCKSTNIVERMQAFVQVAG